MQHIDLRLTQVPSDLQSMARLRYDIYIGEMGWSSQHADHESCTLRDPLDQGAKLFCAFRGAQAIGTIRTSYHGRTDFGFYRELYGIDPLLRRYPGQVSITSMLAVRQPWRKGRLPFQLAMAAAMTGLADGIVFTVIECEPDMVALYRKGGFEIYRDPIMHPDYGKGVCLILNLVEAQGHFREKWKIEAARSAQSHESVVDQRAARCDPGLDDDESDGVCCALRAGGRPRGEC